MGKSKPPSAEVDLVDSYARRVGPDVEIVLAQPGAGLDGDVTVVLHGSGGQRHASGPELLDDERGRRAVVRYPRAALADGTYAVRVRADGADETGRPLGCRLLVQGDRPLVLLWGDEALPSRQPVPHARPAGRRTPVARARAGAGRLRRAVSRRAPGSR